MDGFIGEIRLMAISYVPMYWLPCDGRTVSLMEYQALYAVIGTRYGGNGGSSFNLPNLLTRTAVGAGDDPTDIFDPVVAQGGGASSVTLTQNTLPSHTHTFVGAVVAPTARENTPQGNFLAQEAYVPATTGAKIEVAYGFAPSVPSPTTVNFDANTLSPYPGTGGAHENRQPYLALQYFICTEGEWPNRN